jgi:hypothetical protein
LNALDSESAMESASGDDDVQDRLQERESIDLREPDWNGSGSPPRVPAVQSVLDCDGSEANRGNWIWWRAAGGAN